MSERRPCDHQSGRTGDSTRAWILAYGDFCGAGWSSCEAVPCECGPSVCDVDWPRSVRGPLTCVHCEGG